MATSDIYLSSLRETHRCLLWSLWVLHDCGNTYRNGFYSSYFKLCICVENKDIGVRLTTTKRHNQSVSPHQPSKPFPALKAELMPVQSQHYQGRWCWGVPRACSSHGLSVPEALLQQGCHLGLTAAPGASPGRLLLRPGACKAELVKKLPCRSVTSLLLLALVLGAERDIWTPGDTDGRGLGAATQCKECECTVKAGQERLCPLPGLILPVTCRKMGVIHADIFIILEFYSLWALFKQKFCQYLVFGLISRSSQFSRFLNSYVCKFNFRKLILL